jgi:hypothetical protein
MPHPYIGLESWHAAQPLAAGTLTGRDLEVNLIDQAEERRGALSKFSIQAATVEGHA